MSAIRFGSVLICDDVRREDNGKYILVGVYTGGISFRAPLPRGRSSLFVFGIGRSTPTSFQFEYRLICKADKSVLVAGEGNMEFVGGDKDKETAIDFAFPIGPVQFTVEGLYEVQFRKYGSRWAKMIEFNVNVHKA